GEGRRAHHPSHVAPALRLLDGRRPERARHALSKVVLTSSGNTPLLVFARAPVPGQVKTRLVPLLGPEGAAALHVRLVKHTLATARKASFPRIELHAAPDGDDPFFRFCAGHYRVAILPQADGDLGARMHAAFARALADAPRALIIGTDCPALTA